MKRHNTIKVVLVTLLVFMLLSWILPAAYFSGSYADQGRVQMGLFDLFSYPTTAISYFGYIAVFVLVVGGFYGILNTIPAYRTLLDNTSKKFQKHGNLVISIIMILLAVITSICGLQLGLIIFFPFLVSLILLMGYDKIVAALTLVGSTMIGVAGSLFAYGNTSVIMSTLSLKITSNWGAKLIILVLGLALLIINTILYINSLDKKKKSVKASTKKESTKKESTKKEDTKKSTKKATKTTTKAADKTESVKVVKTKSDIDYYVPTEVKGKHKVWPLVFAFSVIFIIMILAFISWSNAFKISAMEDATSAVTGFKVFGFALFGKLLGNVNAFGSWTLNDLSLVMIVAAAFLMIVYKVKFNDGLQAFITGAKRALEPACLVILIYTCLVTVTYHPFQLTIYKFLFGFTKGFNVFTSSIAAILVSVFNADPLYAFQSVLPYLASLVSKKSTYAVIAVVYQAMYGVTMLVAPTSVVLMTVLSYLGISYKEWWKNIWKLVLELFVLMLIIFTILALI